MIKCAYDRGECGGELGTPFETNPGRYHATCPKCGRKNRLKGVIFRDGVMFANAAAVGRPSIGELVPLPAMVRKDQRERLEGINSSEFVRNAIDFYFDYLDKIEL